MAKGPGGVKPDKKSWDSVKVKFNFINKFSSYRNKVKGKGNEERYNYWYNMFLYERTMANIGCILGQIDTLMTKVKSEKDINIKRKIAEEKVIPLKKEVVGKWQIWLHFYYRLLILPANMGTDRNLEQHSLTNLKTISKYDSILAVILGKPVNEDFLYSYSGKSRLKRADQTKSYRG